MKTISQNRSQINPARQAFAADVQAHAAPLAGNTDELYQEIVKRFESGKPFTTAKAKHYLYQSLGRIDGVLFRLDKRGDETFILSAWRDRQRLGELALARPSREPVPMGQSTKYQALFKKSEFYAWVGRITDDSPPARNISQAEFEAAAYRKSQDWDDQLREHQERASGHYNANLTEAERQAKLAEAQRQQEAARRRLAKIGNGTGYNGFGGPKSQSQSQIDPELAEIARHDPALAERLERRAAAYQSALAPDPINQRGNFNRNFNIERR